MIQKQFSIGVLKINSKYTGEHLCQNVISVKLLCNFIKIALRHRCSPVKLLHIFRTPFPKNTYGGLFLIIESVALAGKYTLFFIKNLDYIVIFV